MKKQGIKHFVKCRCLIPGLSINHQFLVFSILEDDEVKHKFAQCNNCGIVHHVHEISKSSIVNRETMVTIATVDDIASSLNPALVEQLKKHEIDSLPTWEELKFIVDNERWGDHIVLATEKQDGYVNVKLLKVLSRSMSSIDVESRKEVL